MNPGPARFDRFYRVVALALGIVLLTAGGLKVYATAVPDRSSGGGSPRLPDAVAGGAELLFGGWLVAGLYPQRTRFLALAVFIALSNVALYKALADEPSCGCLGRVPTEPWIAVAFDGLAVVALILARPAAGWAGPERGRWVGLALWGLAVAGVVLAVVRPWAAGPSVVLGVAGAHADQELLDRVIRDIEGNAATYRTLAFETDVTLRDLTVSRKQEVTNLLPGGGTATLIRFPERRFVCAYQVSGPNMRWDRTTDGDRVCVEIITDDHRVEYLPFSQRAWIRKPEVNVTRNDWTLDRTTWAVRAPVARPRDWFAAVRVLKVREVPLGGATGVEVEAELPPTARRYSRFVLVFDPNYRHLPVRHEQWNEDGTNDAVTELEYQRLPGRDGWLVRSAVQTLWPGGVSREFDPTTAVNRMEVRVRPGVRVDGDIRPDRFSIALPAQTMTTDNVRQEGSTVFLPKPAADIPAALGQVPVDSPTSGDRLPRPAAWPFVAWNGLLLALCAAFRSRLVAPP